MHNSGFWCPSPPDEAFHSRAPCRRVCHRYRTDARLQGGFVGVLGHEFVGEVVAATADPAWVGRRVVGGSTSGVASVRCAGAAGQTLPAAHVAGIIGRDGVFAEYTTLPIANLHEVPPTLADEQAVFTEPLACLRMLEQIVCHLWTACLCTGRRQAGPAVQPRPGPDRLRPHRHRPPCRQTGAARRAGAAHGHRHAGGRSPRSAYATDIVVEATGAQDGFNGALRLVRPLGTLLLKSTYADTLDSFDLSQLVVDEITIVGSRCGPFPAALAAWPATTSTCVR